MSTDKDERYDTLNTLIAVGKVNSLSEMIKHVPKTTMARDLGMHHITFNKLIENPERFTLKDIYAIAWLIGIDKKKILDLFYNETAGDKKTKRKKL
jgi:hypothetical protein